MSRPRCDSATLRVVAADLRQLALNPRMSIAESLLLARLAVRYDEDAKLGDKRPEIPVDVKVSIGQQKQEQGT